MKANWKRIRRDMSRRNRSRRRFERRCLNSHKRWQIIGNLALGKYRPIDGLTLLRLDWVDLFLASDLDTHVHPRWLAK